MNLFSGFNRVNKHEEEEGIMKCPKCGMVMETDKDDEDNYDECLECGKEYCTNCLVFFGAADVAICEPCIDKAYPVRTKE